jgi:membrane protein
MRDFALRLWKEWNNDNVPRQSAAIAYYTVFSLPSFLLVVITVASLLIGRDAVEGKVFSQLQSSVGADAAAMLQDTVRNIQTVKTSALMTVIGIAMLILGAIGVFRELQTSLNQILRVPARKKAGGLWGLARSYLLSFSLLLTSSFLLLVSMVLSTMVAALSRGAATLVPAPLLLLGLGEWLLSALVIWVIFFLLYRFLPDRRFPAGSLAWGSSAATALFLVGKAVLAIYLATAAAASPYGLTASLLILLLWIYYSSMIFLTGAEVVDARERAKKGN